MMSSSLLFSRLVSRVSRLPVQSFNVPRKTFITITVHNDPHNILTEREQKEEYEQAEFDVAEFGSDPYPYWRKVIGEILNQSYLFLRQQSSISVSQLSASK